MEKKAGNTSTPKTNSISFHNNNMDLRPYENIIQALYRMQKIEKMFGLPPKSNISI